MTRIVFLGTPSAAVPTLVELAKSHDVGLVITQPDRPRGRSGRAMPPPVKEAALDLGVQVTQPETRQELDAAIRDAAPFDVGVVVAYGRILTGEMLAVPTLGFVNVHFSLLPRWRGAAPVERALMAGDSMTGVTIITIDEGLDTGPVLTAQGVDIDKTITGGQLTDVLANVGARLLGTVLPAYVDGSLMPESQVEEGSTYATKLSASDRRILLEESRETTVNRVRALNPSPGATLVIDDEVFKILSVEASTLEPEPGTWVIDRGVPVVGCSDGGLVLVELQPPGKTPRAGVDWARGSRRTSGAVS
ncbi:MAG: methionyl-tRNA formyltransferase [Actinomycetota bacterium]|nr:methionyl-tRNA formyltransferase [Actinomycetota bacterium]